ncbi:MAG: PilZ domain-containing protein [Acidobacteriota bacterium]
MSDEKRKHGRVPLVMEASWEGAGSRSKARTTDISVTGCFIDTQGAVSVGDILNINFIPPDGKPIAVQGRVMYQQRGLGFGVRFIRIPELDRLHLSALLRTGSGETRRTG